MTPLDAAGRTLATTSATADRAMQGWASWVVNHQVDPVKESDVKSAYESYQSYMNLARYAYSEFAITGDQESLDKALNNLNIASTKLSATINILSK